MSIVIVWHQSPIVDSNWMAKYYFFKARECPFCTLTHVPQFRKKFNDQGIEIEREVCGSIKKVCGRFLENTLRCTCTLINFAWLYFFHQQHATRTASKNSKMPAFIIV